MNDVYELVEVMKRLRGQNGCPWDREQSHDSLKPYLIEETYEVLESIDARDDAQLKEELGDLLLQIVFHAQIAAEDRRFTIDDVARSIVTKLKRRHPHVFGEVQVSNSDEVLENWEKIKKGEGKKSVLEGVPKGLPALLKARRVQEKVKRVGFDWEGVDGPLDKVIEEIQELKNAVLKEEKQQVEDEFGDILFSLVNVSRFLGIDAEEALRKSIGKFTHRFKSIEDKIAQRGEKPMENHSIQELDGLWEETKDG